MFGHFPSMKNSSQHRHVRIMEEDHRSRWHRHSLSDEETGIFLPKRRGVFEGRTYRTRAGVSGQIDGTQGFLARHLGRTISRMMGLRRRTAKTKEKERMRTQMAELEANADRTFVIHYSCESFYEKEPGFSPRITSIAVRRLNSSETESFSLDLLAEKLGLARSIDQNYARLEREMLRRFYKFVGQHRDHFWVHWRMCDITYGFPALDHRHSVHRGTPIKIDENNKFDLAHALKAIYGPNYIDHPRLPSLVKRNNLSHQNYLPGADEAKAFVHKNFSSMHRSTIRKTKILGEIFYLACDDKLKTNGRVKRIFFLVRYALGLAWLSRFLFGG